MNEKKIAGEAAAQYIEDGMIVGLGTGSTVFYLIHKVGEMVRNGLKIKAVSTSSETTKLATELGISLLTMNEIDKIDLTIDGADAIDKNFNGVKGRGGALLFEKVVAEASKKNIWIVDSSKMVSNLEEVLLPVEVIPFSISSVTKNLEKMGIQTELRKKNNTVFKTDSGNYILDVNIKGIAEMDWIAKELKLMTGIVEHGLFLNIVDTVIIGGNEPVVLERK